MKKATSVRMVTTIEGKRSHRKGCILYTIYIYSDKGKEDEDDEVLRRYHVL